MDNTNQSQSDQPVVQPSVLQPPVQAPEPVSRITKEVEPALTAEYAPEAKEKPIEYLSESEKQPELHPEVKEAGVEVAPQPQISVQAKQAGVELAKEATPVNKEDQIKEILEMKKTVAKKSGTSNSGSWLMALLNKALKRLRFKK